MAANASSSERRSSRARAILGDGLRYDSSVGCSRMGGRDREMRMSELICASRAVADAEDRVARYCGLEWTGGPSEVWAYPYFDAIVTRADEVEPVDVLACAALHPGLSRDDLKYFRDQRPVLASWLRRMPEDVDLGMADAATADELRELPELARGVGLSLLSKVLHRKRPRLMPMLDRDIVDWYRPVTGLRGVAAWAALVDALRSDLAMPVNAKILARMQTDLTGRVEGPVPSALRLVDIAIWMGGRK